MYSAVAMRRSRKQRLVALLLGTTALAQHAACLPTPRPRVGTRWLAQAAVIGPDIAPAPAPSAGAPLAAALLLGSACAYCTENVGLQSRRGGRQKGGRAGAVRWHVQGLFEHAF